MKRILFLGVGLLSAASCYRRDPQVGAADPTGNPFDRSFVADGQGSNSSGLFQESSTRVGSVSFSGRGANAVPSLYELANQAAALTPATAATAAAAVGSTAATTTVALPPPNTKIYYSVSGEYSNTRSNLARLFESTKCADTTTSNSSDCQQPRRELNVPAGRETLQPKGSTLGATSSAGR